MSDPKGDVWDDGIYDGEYDGSDAGVGMLSGGDLSENDGGLRGSSIIKKFLKQIVQLEERIDK